MTMKKIEAYLEPAYPRLEGKALKGTALVYWDGTHAYSEHALVNVLVFPDGHGHTAGGSLIAGPIAVLGDDAPQGCIDFHARHTGGLITVSLLP